MDDPVASVSMAASASSAAAATATTYPSADEDGLSETPLLAGGTVAVLLMGVLCLGVAITIDGRPGGRKPANGPRHGFDAAAVAQSGRCENGSLIRARSAGAGCSFSINRHTCCHVDLCEPVSLGAIDTAASYSRAASSNMRRIRNTSPTVAVHQ